jgi:hypothetical protein
MPFRIQPGEARLAKAQRSVLATPDFGVQPEQLAPQLGHIWTNFKRLFELGHSAVEAATAFVGNTETNVRGNTFWIRGENAAKGSLSLIELPPGEIGFSKDTMCFEIVWILLKDMLGYSNSVIDLILLEIGARQIVSSLQADYSHIGSSC